MAETEKHKLSQSFAAKEKAPPGRLSNILEKSV
jgi:hypothetical protein